MSLWWEVKDPDDIDLGLDGELHILFDHDYNGAKYVSIPVSLFPHIRKLIEPKPCDRCNGVGFIMKIEDSDTGALSGFARSEPCPKCTKAYDAERK